MTVKTIYTLQRTKQQLWNIFLNVVTCFLVRNFYVLSPFSDLNPCHSLFFDRDHLRSSMGIISGPGSFAVQFGDHLRSWDHLRTHTPLLFAHSVRHIGKSRSSSHCATKRGRSYPFYRQCLYKEPWTMRAVSHFILDLDPSIS